MTNFSVGVASGRATVTINDDLAETDIQEMLSFEPEQVEELLRFHAGNQAYWEALALRLRMQYENYRDIWHRKWWSHCNKYARSLSAVYGDAKPSGQVVSDIVIQVFSADTTPAERERYAVQAWTYEIKKSMSVGTQAEYTAKMYKYLNTNPSWFFETVVSTLKDYEAEYEAVRVAASRLNSKAYDMGLYTKMQMAKRGNVGS